MSDIVYFELNNWFQGRDYPAEEPFITWVNKHTFSNEEWCKENKLCVLAGNFDMSSNWCIAATKEWVLANCPRLLEDHHFDCVTVVTKWNPEKGAMDEEVVRHDHCYAEFLRQPDKYGQVEGQFGWVFPEYCEENFGVKFCNDEGVIEDE